MMRLYWKRLHEDESAATAVEYALITLLIAMVIVAALPLVGSSLGSRFESIASVFN